MMLTRMARSIKGLLLDFGTCCVVDDYRLGFAMLGFALDRIFNPRLRGM